MHVLDSSFLHAMTSAIVDSTASILSEHFLKFTHSLHHESFPLRVRSCSALTSTALTDVSTEPGWSVPNFQDL